MRPKYEDVEHLLRLAGIFLAGLVAFVVIRGALVPPDFGLLGHYRASAIDDVREKPVVYAGQATCAGCHTDVVERRSTSRHVGLACEGCHGPLASHASGARDDKPTRPDGRALCARCHTANAGRPAWLRTVSPREHAGEEPCISCHQPHAPAIR